MARRISGRYARRTFLGLGLMLVGSGRPAWAQTADTQSGYAPLTRPVRIPLDAVATPWRTVPFTAEAMRAATAEAPARRVVLKGVLYRKTMENGSSDLSALCVTCPHELCPVDLVTDPERLAKMGDAKSPLFECGCHFSKFDAREDGEWISGVAYRGLFRFQVTAIGNDAAEVTHIEEEALSVV
jgi:Rieske Fe-S protein